MTISDVFAGICFLVWVSLFYAYMGRIALWIARERRADARWLRRTGLSIFFFLLPPASWYVAARMYRQETTSNQRPKASYYAVLFVIAYLFYLVPVIIGTLALSRGTSWVGWALLVALWLPVPLSFAIRLALDRREWVRSKRTLRST